MWGIRPWPGATRQSGHSLLMALQRRSNRRCMARRFSITVRLDPEDARALARARKNGISTAEIIRQGVRIVAARYYKKGHAPSTGLFVSTSIKLGDESELFKNIDD